MTGSDVGMPKRDLSRVEWTLKTIRKLTSRGQKVADVVALSYANDPWLASTRARLARAEWFAELWAEHGGQGVHLRRLHYQLVSQDPPVSTADGEQYQNTKKHWTELVNAGRDARYLNLVLRGAFVDRRNDDPIVMLQWPQDVELYRTDGAGFRTANIYDKPPLPHWDVGERSPTVPQPFHVEVWCEKTSANDVLLPLCQRYRCNLVTGAGEASLTMADQLIERARRSERPVRILYVSDFDPSGQSMPIATARKIEYRVYENDDIDRDEIDIELHPIVLTADQVRKYRLPRIPIKESETRAGKFEKQHGAGGVELDALEACGPASCAGSSALRSSATSTLISAKRLRKRSMSSRPRSSASTPRPPSRSPTSWPSCVSDTGITPKRSTWPSSRSMSMQPRSSQRSATSSAKRQSLSRQNPSRLTTNKTRQRSTTASGHTKISYGSIANTRATPTDARLTRQQTTQRKRADQAPRRRFPSAGPFLR
jgi:hypothetical protein